jgi:L-iditol 2-dehydrogenase
MKAAVLHANRDIRYEEYEMPRIRPGTVKLRVRASGICGSDVPRALSNGAHGYPIVLGHEFSGDIVEIGEGVSGFQIGDQACAAPLVPCMECHDCKSGSFALCKHYSFIGSREQGGFAEYVVIPAANAVKFDSSIPYEQAALFEPSAVALHGLLLNEFQGGGNVAILGGGTIGLFVMQWARIFGAKKTVVFDIDEGRLDLAKRLGADEAADSKSGFSQIPGGFDFVFETAGASTTMHAAFELASSRAKVCFIGTPHADLTFTPNLWENLNRKEFRLTGSWMSYSAPFPGREWTLSAHYFKSGQLLFDGGIIFRKLPLSECASAFKLFDDPAGVHGKIMFILD